MDELTTALYVRVSTDAQVDEGYSIDAQKEALASFCDARKYERYDYYVDGGYTGSNIERPDMERLIADIKQKNISRVIVYKLDRLSRNLRDTMYLIEDVFIPHNVDFISINESFDTSTAFGKACIAILSVFAQLERENIYLRTRMGMRKRVQSGLWMGGGRTPFGYDYDKEQGILAPNKDADTVRKIYELYLQGYSVNKIASTLDFRSERLVSQILQRKSNCGYIVYNGEEYLGKHEPIIDLETYQKTMWMMEQRSKNQLYSDSPHLLTGLVECGVCGAKMRYQPWGKGQYRLYCYSHQKSKPHLIKDPNCDNGSPKPEIVEGYVLDKLFKASLDIADQFATGRMKINIKEELTKQLSTAKSRLKKLYTLYSDSTQDDEILVSSIEEIKQEISRINQRIEIEDQKTEAEIEKNNAIELLRSLSSVWEYSTGQEKKVILNQLIDKIVITHTNIDIMLKPLV